MNKNHLNFLLIFVASSLMLTGCAAIEGIFEAGFWTAIIGVIIIVLIIGFLIKKIRGR